MERMHQKEDNPPDREQTSQEIDDMKARAESLILRGGLDILVMRGKINLSESEDGGRLTARDAKTGEVVFFQDTKRLRELQSENESRKLN